MSKYYRPEQLPQAPAGTAVEQSEPMTDFVKRERESTLARAQKDRKIGERQLRALHGDQAVDDAKRYGQI